ncbi:hypothetical protein BIW11_06741 [Tropilaelaps mercedesae]|uniref:Uncharacterized protein n=1 Tax=Tropilaelaps mercedesae TaxID=418985 RepID=A0A1V9XWQ1_9ACAR|nr:hypothetical protein BIW11_06741 [Tropilaelaps mercedesae]
MPVLGVRELERELLSRKSGREHDMQHGTEREGRSRRGRRYRSTSYDSRPRSNSAPRRSGSVASTMSMNSRRGGRGQMHAGNQNLPSLKNLRKQLRSRCDAKTMLVVTRYIEEMELSAEVVNNINYLRRCRDLCIIPREYWMINASIRNTREVLRMLDECSYRLMCHDQQYHMLRRAQLTKQLSRTEEQLEKLLSLQDHQRLCAVVRGHRSDLFSRIRDEQRKAVDVLRKEVEDYHSYLRERRKPRRSGENGSENGNRRRSRNRSKGDNEESKPKLEANIKGSAKDSDGEDKRRHRVQRRAVGSTFSHDDDSVSDGGDEQSSSSS